MVYIVSRKVYGHFCVGMVMALIQGGYIRKIPLNKIKSTAVTGLWIIIPSFIAVGLATSGLMLYIGLFLFAVCKFC